MSRFDFDDYGQTITWEMAEYNLRRHLDTKRGQDKLREFREALLAVPGHRLIEGDLVTTADEVCAVGAFAAYKRTQQGKTWAEAAKSLRELTAYSEFDCFDTQDVGVRECGMTRTLAWKIAYDNDETFGRLTPEVRWQRFLDWVNKEIGRMEFRAVTSTAQR